ncbi:hypothetical protein C8F01DRAFT_976713, partial [Mycena amicta]
YQVHIGMFISLSPVWKAILEIPSSTTDDADPEGSKGNPIFLEGITVDEMDDFLVYIYRQLWTDRRYASMQAVERSHVNLLKLASLWQIETARDHLPGGELTYLDFKTYTIIARGMERRMVERQRVARVAPAMSSDPTWTCESHAKCILAWKKLWWSKIAPKILHPDNPLPIDRIADEVQKISDLDLKNRCRDDMVQAIKGGAIGFPDEKIIEGVVQAIKVWYNDSALTMERRVE